MDYVFRLILVCFGVFGISLDVYSSCSFSTWVPPSSTVCAAYDRYCKPLNANASELYVCTDSCAPPSVRNISTGVCSAPVVCRPPETDNGFGLCAVKECTGGQVLNPSTGVCQTPPTCGQTQTLNNVTNLCELLPLRCPLNSHANTANDKCLDDPPRACPIGQHDDGTYNCVANDATGCTSNQIKGYIFGIPQCIKKVNVDEFAKQAADVAATKAASEARVAASQNAADGAAAALALDPTNTTKQATNTAAQSTLTADKSTLSKDTQKSSDAQNAENTAALKAIAASTKSLDDRAAQDAIDGFGVVSVPDVLPTTTADFSVIPTVSTMGCPAPAVMSLSHGNMSMSYEPYCSFASFINPLILTLAYLSGAFIIIGGLRD
jgi:hypothetical protein